ncbi:MAG TPA: hypothetical protein PKD18_14310 [Saprospiraceae bacterium]|nr:hypothetical protein [Saprospiraceae bacterium]
MRKYLFLIINLFLLEVNLTGQSQGKELSICDSINVIKLLLEEKDFRPLNITVISDIPADSEVKNDSSSNIVIGEQNIIINFNGEIINYYESLLTRLRDMATYDLTTKGFISTNKNFCGGEANTFSLIEKQFYSSDEEVLMWYHIFDNPNSDADILFEKAIGIEEYAFRYLDREMMQRMGESFNLNHEMPEQAGSETTNMEIDFSNDNYLNILAIRTLKVIQLIYSTGFVFTH